ncbi:MAG: hypothetical protein ACI4IS_03650 [Acutalibacteraceae bacterium]
MKMQKRRIKFKSKKGVSMVLAIALVLVLFLTTGSFLSIAMLQQKETGSQLNSRQAYVSAKSALDLAQELVLSNKLTVPIDEDVSRYYVLYYDASGEVQISGPFDTAQEALDEINSLKGLHYTIVGDSYIKVTRKPGGTVDMSAFSSEGKYTSDSDDKRDSDLSISFDVTKKPVTEERTETLKINVKDIVRPKTEVTGSLSDFLMVGAQTNYSMRMSEGNYAGWQQQLLKQTDDEGGLIFQMNNNATEDVIESRFPLVFTEAVKNDTNDHRSIYNAYNQGVYFLGNYNGKRVTNATGYKDGANHNVSYFTNDNVYGVELECEFLTIAHNMLSRTRDKSPSFVVRCSSKDRNRYGVVVRFLNDVDLDCYDSDGYRIPDRSQHYEAGYYWVVNGEDLFNPVYVTPLKNMNVPGTDHYDKYQMVKDLDVYDEAIAGRDVHSAYESISYKTPVKILNENSEFQTDNNSWSAVERFEAPTNDWKDYSIYCAPNKMPGTNGFYDMYSKEFFYLWYNVNEMVVKNDVKMSIRSDDATLMINPKTDEANSGVKTTIKNEGTGEFWIRPYWGKNACSLMVGSTFYVQYSGGTYTVNKGMYSIKNNGINLFSPEGEQFFLDNDGKVAADDIDSSEADIGWVNSSGEINSSITTQNQTGKYIDFIAKSGQLANVQYEAKTIDCDFSAASSISTGASSALRAENIIIKANEFKGDYLRIDTSMNSTTCEFTDINGVKTTKTGQVILISSRLTLRNSAGDLLKVLEPGYYFFNTTAPVNLMDVASWESNYHYVTEAQKNTEVSTIKTVTVGYKDEVTIGEGRYY